MSPRPHVVHLISGDLWAGAEAATFQLVRALADRDTFRVSVVALNEGELARRLRASGIATEVVPEAELPLPALVRRVRRGVAGADLLHAHRAKENWIASRCGVPWLTTRHGRPERFAGLRGARAAAVRLVDRVTVRLGARRVVAVSEEVASWLRGHVPAQRIDVIPNGLRDPWPAGPPPWDGRPRRAGVLARLVPVKALHLALESVARVPALELDVVGEGPERDALQARARELGIAPRVHFLGFDPDPTPRLASWSVLLVTSEHEGHPMTVVEAMAAGTPVATVPLRGLIDMIGAGGRAASSRSPRDVARSLHELLEARTGRRASQEARERFLGSFTDDRVAAAMEVAYRSALRDGPRSVGGGRETRWGKEGCSRVWTERSAGEAARSVRCSAS